MTSESTHSLAKAYNPAAVEQELYSFWETAGFFTPEIDPARQPFTIIMPPPNVSGDLHLGSVLFVTLEDILTRWHRMRGEPTLWLPGEDHAAIATQNVVERELAQEGLSRHDIGREAFAKRAREWMEQYRGKIRDQLKRLGASCDWTRECFTLDPGPAKAVRTTFVNLYNEGLIYRGERIINWCPRCQTAISDLEVEHHEAQDHLWYVRYPLLDDDGQPSGDYITIATTRPETIVADVAVAVNPNDERYKGIVGRTALLPVMERKIPVIADEAVDPAFGTGALKITPGHDPVDFEVGQRHDLETISAINLDATMSDAAGPYKGMDRFECRAAIEADLEKGGYLVKVEPYTHSVGHCQRCHTLVEPLVSKQWFLRMEPLAKPAIDVVTGGRIRFVPERFTKIYLNWMENIRDWCISRQLWLGHPIPVWYCRDCDGLTVTVGDPDVCQHCGSQEHRARPRRARHVVLFRPLAALDARLAGRDGRPQVLLPDVRHGDRLRHHLLLGRPHDHDGPLQHEGDPVPHRLPARPGPRRARREDQQVEGDDEAPHTEPAGGHRDRTAPTPCATPWRPAARPATTCASRSSGWRRDATSPTSSGTPRASSSAGWKGARSSGRRSKTGSRWRWRTAGSCRA